MNHTGFLLGTSFFTTSSSFSIMLKVAATACGTTKLDQHGKNILPGIGRNVARYTETVYIHAYHIQYRQLNNKMNIHIHSMNSFEHQSFFKKKISALCKMQLVKSNISSHHLLNLRSQGRLKVRNKLQSISSKWAIRLT